MFLAGDIGGTKTNLAVYAYHDGVLEAQKAASFPSAGHASLAEIVRAFLGAGIVDPACLLRRGGAGEGRPRAGDEPAVGGRRG